MKQLWPRETEGAASSPVGKTPPRRGMLRMPPCGFRGARPCQYPDVGLPASKGQHNPRVALAPLLCGPRLPGHSLPRRPSSPLPTLPGTCLTAHEGPRYLWLLLPSDRAPPSLKRDSARAALPAGHGPAGALWPGSLGTPMAPGHLEQCQECRGPEDPLRATILSAVEPSPRPDRSPEVGGPAPSLPHTERGLRHRSVRFPAEFPEKRQL